MDTALISRRDQTKKRLEQIVEQLADAEARYAENACVYATGSYGRGESSSTSDLDLFIVGRSDGEDRKFKRLDEICLKASLIEVTRTLGIRDFSGDGEYLEHYSVRQLVKTLGTPTDDSSNTFTARLLLLLESCPIVGRQVYSEVIEDVIQSYWRDFDDHETEFMPAFFTNDVLRLWRTFCVNYEARNSSDPIGKKLKRRLNNYKLKHSRLLTCYSTLLCLLAKYVRNATVTPQDMQTLVLSAPTERIEWLQGWWDSPDVADVSSVLLEQYNLFLANTSPSENDLLDTLRDKNTVREYTAQAASFGDTVFQLLRMIGEGNPYYRLLIV